MNYSTTLQSATASLPSTAEIHPTAVHVLLVSIYVVALIGGTTGIIFMSLILKKQRDNLSITNISILNLMVAHGLFLLTVPFRIDYYSTNYWHYCFGFCKLVSITAHIHLYLAFFFYVLILVVRFLPSFGWTPMHFQQPLIAFISSATIWVLFTVSVFMPLWIKYGNSEIYYNITKCFEFHVEIKGNVQTFNIVIAAVVLAITCTTLATQGFILLKMVRANHCNLLSQQEFRAQLKNVGFISIMVICFLPYHIFRIYYVQNTKNKQLQTYNDVFLAISTLCCLDLLTFIAINK